MNGDGWILVRIVVQTVSGRKKEKKRTMERAKERQRDPERSREKSLWTVQSLGQIQEGQWAAHPVSLLLFERLTKAHTRLLQSPLSKKSFLSGTLGTVLSSFFLTS